MNQSSEASLIKLLHDSLSQWLKFAKEFNELQTLMDQREESIKACKSLTWLPLVPSAYTRLLLTATVSSLERKLNELKAKEANLKQEFTKVRDYFERALVPFLSTQRVHGQATANVLPGVSCDSYTVILMVSLALQEALNRQCFFNATSNARHEAVKFLDDGLANEIQQMFSRYRSALTSSR
jgi:hypothetical protein